MRHARRGFSLVEMLAVLAVLVILGAAVLPTLDAVRGDSRLRAAADLLKARVADARVQAMDDGRPYRLALHRDGQRLRLAPDAIDFGDQVDGTPTPDGQQTARVIEDTLPAQVTGRVVADDEMMMSGEDASGWVLVATFHPDGTCREDNAVVEISELHGRPLYVRLRGLTAATTVLTAAQAGVGR